MIDHSFSANCDTALALAARGLSVFPCQAGGAQSKQPIKGIKWRDVSTTDPHQIKQWWQQWPQAAIGLDLGKSDLIVIDCDRHGADDGVEAFGALCHAHHHLMDVSPLVATPNDGCHVYFRQHTTLRGNRRGCLPKGIDVRGCGGYAIAPGTVMQDGRCYELVGDLSHTPLLPQWLAALLDDQPASDGFSPEISADAATPPSPIMQPHAVHTSFAPHQPHAAIASSHDRQMTAYCDAAIMAQMTRLKSAPQGNRNNSLNEAAFALGQLVGSGWIGENIIQFMLLDAARGLGLPAQEALKTIESGLQAGKKQPRHLSASLTGSMPHLTMPQSMRPRDQHEGGQQWGGQQADGAQRIDPDLLSEPQILPNEEAVLQAEARDAFEEGTEWDKSQAQMSFPYPPGLVGEIARWIVNTARYKQPELAIGAALGIVGTFAGRQFAGPTRSGTHLYILGLAPTGKGKDHALQQIMRIMGAAKLPQHIGPSEFISMPAVINFLTRKPLSICAMDEFGDFMKRINSRRASGFENAISKVLRTLWSSSFAPFVTPEWASRASETIFCPAITIYGASTPAQFYAAMEGTSLENGTLNRFLLINGRHDVVETDPQMDATQVPPDMIAALKRIYNHGGQLATGFRNDALTDPAANGQIYTINWGMDGAQYRYQDFSREIAQRMEKQVDTAAFYARTVEMALRIATIIAIGRQQGDHLCLSDMDYGIMVARQSADFMEQGAADYMADNENQANAQRIIRALKRRGGRISHRDLVRSLQNSIRGRDLKELLTSLVEGGQITHYTVKPMRGPASLWYHLQK